MLDQGDGTPRRFLVLAAEHRSILAAHHLAHHEILLWTPRLLGVAVSLFVGLFALDAFSEGRPLSEAILAFLIHLIPALVLLLTVAVSWRWEWVGGITFVALAVLYAVMVSRNHPAGCFVISGPLLVVGALFLWSWRHHGKLHSRAV